MEYRSSLPDEEGLVYVPRLHGFRDYRSMVPGRRFGLLVSGSSIRIEEVGGGVHTSSREVRRLLVLPGSRMTWLARIAELC